MGRGRQVATVVAIGLAAVAVAPAAAGRPLHVANRSTTEGGLPDWLLIVPAFGLALALAGLVLALRDAGGPRQPVRRRSMLPALFAIGLGVLIASLLSNPDEGTDLADPSLPAPEVPETEPARDRTTWPTWALLAGAGAVAAVALAHTAGRRGRTSPPPVADGDHDAEARAVVAESARQLAAPDDPREGVIAAYAT